MTETPTLPRWDPTALFPSLESREFAAAHEGLGAQVARLVALYDEHGVAEVAAHAPDAGEVAAFEAIIGATNDVNEAMEQLEAFTYAFVSTDSRDATAQGVLSELERHEATLRQLSARF